MFSTALNLALPLIICSKASVTCSSGKTSVIGLTSERTLNHRVSCESTDVPLGQPISVRRPIMKGAGGTSIGSSEAPIITNFLSTARPPRMALIAFPLGTVASITLAPPNLASSSAAFWDLLSMYWLAPNLLASSSLSFPRPTTSNKIAASTRFTMTAVTWEPADPHSLSLFPWSYFTAYCVNDTRNFVTRNPWILNSRD